MSDQNDDTPSGVLQEQLRRLIEKRQLEIDNHAVLRATPPFKAAVKQLDRIAEEYLLALVAIELMATRWPPFFERLITLRVTPHLVQSVSTAVWMMKEGALDPARRELRFLLEASVKALWLDAGAPRIHDTKFDHADSVKPFDVAGKVETLNDLGRERFGDIVASLKFGLLNEQEAQAYRETATDLYGNLSSFNHMTSGNVARDLRNFDRHRFFGFESVADMDAVARLAKRVLDLALASHFEAFNSGLVGDILVQIFDDRPQWTFRKTRLVGAIVQYFDYKAECSQGG